MRSAARAMKIRVFLADDHALVRAGIRALLEKAGIEVAGEAGTGREALERIERNPPDVAILGISTREGGGFETADGLRRRCPKVRVLMLSGHSDAASVQRALRSGAAGYLPKSCASAELVHAIRTVQGGHRYLARSIAEGAAAAEAAAPDLLASLSRREREVLELVAGGRSVPQAAGVLGVSPRTVETYCLRLYEKLRVKDRRELIIFAVRNGIVPAA